MTSEERQPDETPEAYTLRVDGEKAALEEEISRGDVAPENADSARALLLEKHDVEKQLNACFPSMETYLEYKALVTYMPSHPLSVAGAEASTHESKTQEPSDDILGVAVEEGDALDENAKRTIRYINAIREPDQKRAYAEVDLDGGIRETDGVQINGLIRGLDNREEMRAKLANTIEKLLVRQKYLRTIDKSLLEKDAAVRFEQEWDTLQEDLERFSKQIRGVERDIHVMQQDEQYAKEYINKADHAVGGNIEIVMRNFSSLPEDLQAAIRAENQDIFRKYGVDSWSARLIGAELERRERTQKSEQALIETFPMHSRNAIESVLRAKGISNEEGPILDLGGDIKKLVKLYGKKGAMSLFKDIDRDTTSGEMGDIEALNNFVQSIYLIEGSDIINEQTGEKFTPVSTPTVAQSPMAKATSAEQSQSSIVYSAEAGKVLYDAHTDDEKVLELEALNKILHAGLKREPISYSPVPKVEADPILAGVMHYDDKGNVLNESGKIVVEKSPELAVATTPESKIPVPAPMGMGVVSSAVEAVINPTPPEAGTPTVLGDERKTRSNPRDDIDETDWRRDDRTLTPTAEDPYEIQTESLKHKEALLLESVATLIKEKKDVSLSEIRAELKLSEYFANITIDKLLSRGQIVETSPWHYSWVPESTLPSSPIAAAAATAPSPDIAAADAWHAAEIFAQNELAQAPVATTSVDLVPIDTGTADAWHAAETAMLNKLAQVSAKATSAEVTPVDTSAADAWHAAEEQTLKETVTASTITPIAGTSSVDTAAADAWQAAEELALKESTPTPAVNVEDEPPYVVEFREIQKRYFDTSARLIRELGEASRVGDTALVERLEADRSWYEEVYAFDVSQFEKIGKGELPHVPPSLPFEPTPEDIPSIDAIEHIPDIVDSGEAIVDIPGEWNADNELLKIKRLNLERSRLLKEYKQKLVDHRLSGMSEIHMSLIPEIIHNPDMSLSELMGKFDALGKQFAKDSSEIIIGKEELEEMKALKEERVLKLREFREKLARQRIGIANIQDALIAEVRGKPGMTVDEFMNEFINRGKEFEVNSTQVAIARKAFEKYTLSHQAVERNFAKYPDPKVFFEACFGRAPKGEVEVIKGPLTVYFRIHEIEDYTVAYNGDDVQDLTPEDIAIANKMGGAANVRSRIVELQGSVMIENALEKAFEGYAKSTYDHEEQHALNIILRRNQKLSMNYARSENTQADAAKVATELFAQMKSASGEESHALRDQFESELESIAQQDRRQLRVERSWRADKHAADEILAYAKDGRDLNKIFSILTKKKADGGLYDYLSDEKVADLYSKTEVDMGFHDVEIDLIMLVHDDYEQVKRDVFGREYETLLSEGIQAYQELRDAGMPEEAIRNVFQHEPLVRWAKVAERLIEDGPVESLSPEVASKFVERFPGMNAEVLEATPGFTDLSPEQQLLVLERMKTVAFEDINKEKIALYRKHIDDLAKADADVKASDKGGAYKFAFRLANKLRQVGMKATKEYQIGKKKDEAAAKWLSAEDADALQMKKDALEGLVRMALVNKDFGVRETRYGLETIFVSEENFRGDITLEDKVTIYEFQEVANRYANTKFGEQATKKVDPSRFGKKFGDKIRTVEQAELESRYETLASRVTALLAEHGKGKWKGDNAAEWRTKLEGEVTTSRFYGDHPELDKELEEAGKNVGAAVGFKTLLFERGAYSVGSAGVRFLTASAIGLAAAPLVAALGGGIMGWVRGKKEMTENDLLAQMGERDKSDDEAQKMSSGNEKDRARNIISSTQLTDKLETLLAKFAAASTTPTQIKRRRDEDGRFEVNDTTHSITGLEYPLEFVSDKAALRRTLEARIAYTVRKIDEKSIDLGGKPSERAANIARLAMALGKAKSALEFTDALHEHALQVRMNAILDIREKKIDWNRKKHLLNQAKNGALMGATFAGAGLALGWLIPGHAKAGEIKLGGGSEAPNDAFKEAALSGQAVKPVVPASAPVAVASAAAPQPGIPARAAEGIATPASAASVRSAPTASAPGISSGSAQGVVLPKGPASAVSGSGSSGAQAAAVNSQGGTPQTNTGIRPEVAPDGSDQHLANKILGERGAANPLPAPEKAPAVPYHAKPNDSLTSILKKESVLKDLKPFQQENAIQNLIRKLTPEQMREIGITNPNRIEVNQAIRIDKLNEYLGGSSTTPAAENLKVGGESLIEHAQKMESAYIKANIAEEGGTPSDFRGAPHEKILYKDFKPETDTPRLMREQPISGTPPRAPQQEIVGAINKASVPLTREAMLKSPFAKDPVTSYQFHNALRQFQKELHRPFSVQEAHALEKLGYPRPFSGKPEYRLLEDARAEILRAMEGSKKPLDTGFLIKTYEHAGIDVRTVQGFQAEAVRWLGTHELHRPISPIESRALIEIGYPRRLPTTAFADFTPAEKARYELLEAMKGRMDMLSTEQVKAILLKHHILLSTTPWQFGTLYR